MYDHKHTLQEDDLIKHLGDILKEKYPSVYQVILEGKRTALLERIALCLETSEAELIIKLASLEANKLLKCVELSQEHMKSLMDQVDNMKYAP